MLPATPVPNTNRTQSLDVLRGIAVLGILLVNIYSFAMPEAIRANPYLLDLGVADVNDIDKFLWYAINIFADTKFITLLALLFGAGLWLFDQQQHASERHVVDALQYRRSLWLLIFGLLHSYLLWDGDVLFTYAIGSLIAWRWRHWSDARLLKTACAILLIQGLPSLLMAFAPQEFTAPAMAHPTRTEILADIAQHQQGWWANTPTRIRDSLALQFAVVFTGWSSLAAMLVGIVLARCGYLTLQVSIQDYRRLVVVTLLPGLLLVLLSLGIGITLDFAARYTYTLGYQLHDWGSMLMACGYVGLIMGACRAGLWLRMRNYLANAGRMALTLYLMQSLLCTFLFYGQGLGFYGKFSLSQVLLMVMGIGLLQIIFATQWLQHFYYGPLEWLWRSLAYQQRQVFRR